MSFRCVAGHAGERGAAAHGFVDCASAPRSARCGAGPARARRPCGGTRSTRWCPSTSPRRIQHHFEAALKGQTRRFELVTHATYRCTIAPVLDDAGEIAGALAIGVRRGPGAARRACGSRRAGPPPVAAVRGRPPRRAGAAAPAARRARGRRLRGRRRRSRRRRRPDVRARRTPTAWCHVRAGHGWGEGFVGTEFHMESLADERRERYASGPGRHRRPPERPERGAPGRCASAASISSAMVLVGRPTPPPACSAPRARSRRSFGGRDLDFLSAVAHVLNGAMGPLEVERDPPRRPPRRAHRAAQPDAAARAPAPTRSAAPTARAARSRSTSSTSTT